MRRADVSNSFPKRTKRLPSEMSITEPKHFLVARSPKAAPAQAPTAPGRPERVGPTVGRGLAARVCRIKGAWCVILAVVPVMSHTGSMPASAVPVKAMATRNWSGYSLAGSGFTPVTGTFNVPAPFRSASCLEETSVWVGVDGVDNHDLLQAGIAEAGFAPPNNPGRAEWPEPEAPPILCGGPVRIFAWWEDLPSGPVRVNLPVAVGDSVAVSIFKMSPGWWALAVHDLTTKRSFLLAQPYAGPQTSVEWVVEAPQIMGVLSNPVPFSTVNFRDLGADGEARDVERCSFRSEDYVASPSDVIWKYRTARAGLHRPLGSQPWLKRAQQLRLRPQSGLKGIDG